MPVTGEAIATTFDESWSPHAEDARAELAALAAMNPDTAFRFCKVTAVAFGTSVTVSYGGTAIPIPAGAVLCAWPRPNDWVVLGVNGSDRFILNARTAAPSDYDARLYYYNGSGYSEIPSYGSYTAKEWEVTQLTGWYCQASCMIRLGAGKNLGTSSNYIALSLPKTAGITLGNGVAVAIGRATLGWGFGNHAQVGVHAGRVNDASNGDYCWFVGTDADPNISLFGIRNGDLSGDLNDVHVTVQYRRAP